MKMAKPRKHPKMKEVIIEITDVHGKGKCSRGHQVGEIFEYPEDRAKMCPSALSVIRPYILVLAYGGSNIYNKDNPDSFSVSCPDAKHPVVYEITRKSN